MYDVRIREVDASDEEHAEIIHEFNREAVPTFPALTDDELEGENCFWWIAYVGRKPVGFAGVVPSRHYPMGGYLKRSYVTPRHRGGFQVRFLQARERKARKIGWKMLVTETVTYNCHSANNLIKCGYRLFNPKEKWATDSVYWRKDL